jgi:hypothetical protein
MSATSMPRIKIPNSIIRGSGLTARYIKNWRLGVKRAFGSKGEDQHMLLPLMVLPYPFCGFKITMGTQISRSREKRRQGQNHKAQYRKFPMVLGSISWFCLPFVGNLKLSFRVVPVRGGHKRKVPRLVLGLKCVYVSVWKFVSLRLPFCTC